MSIYSLLLPSQHRKSSIPTKAKSSKSNLTCRLIDKHLIPATLLMTLRKFKHHREAQSISLRSVVAPLATRRKRSSSTTRHHLESEQEVQRPVKLQAACWQKRRMNLKLVILAESTRVRKWDQLQLRQSTQKQNKSPRGRNHDNTIVNLAEQRR